MHAKYGNCSAAAAKYQNGTYYKHSPRVIDQNTHPLAHIVRGLTFSAILNHP